ncbi:MAG: hypothetical protein JWP88_2281 [Flaviaesturariibacter sp.]|nr:hypothetical protein [Flaviaesturariibacter sp.]
MKINALVVTYNRLPLLKKCIAAIQSQTLAPDAILVINNSSTDGTPQWLEERGIDFITLANNGCSASLNAGLTMAYNRGTDWNWIMDDDTIPEPQALEHLVKGIHYFEACKTTVGFFSSLVLWTDGNPHLMNQTPSCKNSTVLINCAGLNEPSPYEIISGATFVSMLVSRQSIEKIGLPIKEFFIWSDDIEFTRRMITAGLPGVLVKDSVVIHETPTNYKNDIFLDGVQNIWKYEHGLRNELYIRRTYKSGSSFWRNFAKRMVVWPVSILQKRKDHRWDFIKVVWRSSLAAIRFLPKVEKVANSNKMV